MRGVFCPPPGAASAQNINFRIFLMANFASPPPKTPTKWYHKQCTAHFFRALLFKRHRKWVQNTKKVIWTGGGLIWKIEKNFFSKSVLELSEVFTPEWAHSKSKICQLTSPPQPYIPTRKSLGHGRRGDTRGKFQDNTG